MPFNSDLHTSRKLYWWQAGDLIQFPQRFIQRQFVLPFETDRANAIAEDMIRFRDWIGDRRCDAIRFKITLPVGGICLYDFRKTEYFRLRSPDLSESDLRYTARKHHQVPTVFRYRIAC